MALWTPADITTALWLDASDATTITESSGAVSQMDDKSGNNNHAKQTTSAKQPFYDSVDNIIEFGNSSSSYFTIDGDNLSNTNLDFFAVYRNRETLTPPTVGAIFSNIPTGIITDGCALTTHNTYVDTNYTLRIEGSGIDSTIFRVNGTIGTSYSYNTPTLIQWSIVGVNTNTDTAHIGSFSDANFKHLWDLYEIVAVKSNLSQTDRELVEGYLAWKWGLEGNLPSGHPYELAAPTIESGLTLESLVAESSSEALLSDINMDLNFESLVAESNSEALLPNLNIAITLDSLVAESSSEALLSDLSYALILDSLVAESQSEALLSDLSYGIILESLVAESSSEALLSNLNIQGILNLESLVAESTSEALLPNLNIAITLDSLVAESSSEALLSNLNISLDLKSLAAESSSEALLSDINFATATLTLNSLVAESSSEALLSSLNIALTFNDLIAESSSEALLSSLRIGNLINNVLYTFTLRDKIEFVITKNRSANMLYFQFSKQSDEIIPIAFNCSKLLQSTESISSIDVKAYYANEDVSSDIIENYVIDEDVIKVRVKGGDGNKKYKITVKATTDESNIYEVDVFMNVKNI